MEHIEEKMEVQPNENSATLFSTKAERINVQSSTDMDNLNPGCCSNFVGYAFQMREKAGIFVTWP